MALVTIELEILDENVNMTTPEGQATLKKDVYDYLKDLMDGESLYFEVEVGAGSKGVV